MKLYHCKKCGTFIGSYGCDELCPTCRRKETYLTKEEVAAMFEELQTEIEEKKFLESNCSFMDKAEEKNYAVYTDDISEIIQQKIDKLKKD